VCAGELANYHSTAMELGGGGLQGQGKKVEIMTEGGCMFQMVFCCRHLKWRWLLSRDADGVLNVIEQSIICGKEAIWLR
jgi:hypothetical protein